MPSRPKPLLRRSRARPVSKSTLRACLRSPLRQPRPSQIRAQTTEDPMKLNRLLLVASFLLAVLVLPTHPATPSANSQQDCKMELDDLLNPQPYCVETPFTCFEDCAPLVYVYGNTTYMACGCGGLGGICCDMVMTQTGSITHFSHAGDCRQGAGCGSGTCTLVTKPDPSGAILTSAACI
jgi:hypothetical protein